MRVALGERAHKRRYRSADMCAHDTNKNSSTFTVDERKERDLVMCVLVGEELFVKNEGRRDIVSKRLGYVAFEHGSRRPLDESDFLGPGCTCVLNTKTVLSISYES